MKDLIILGSTGSIGTQALDTVRQYPEKLNVLGLCCDKNVELLQKQIDEFTPKYVAVKNKEAAEKYRDQAFQVMIYRLNQPF